MHNLYICLLAVSYTHLLSNVNVYAATNQTLELNKDYYFDLNGDGQAEKIKYTTQVNKDDNDFFNSVSLFINDKNVYTKKLTDTWAKYKMCIRDRGKRT